MYFPDYDRIIIIHPKLSACGGFGGVAIIGKSLYDTDDGTVNASLHVVNGNLTLGTIAHEFGHNLGLQHATGLDCAGDTVGANCTISEYGDPFDIMDRIL